MTLAGVARYRALQAERWERGDAQFTEAESAELQQIGRGTAIPNDPIALLPVAQLYVPEVPDLQGRGPAGSDLLQVLWCPFDHLQDEEYQPKTALYWRDSTRITDILTDPPQPAAVMLEDYVPEPCVLDPEQIIEYPSSHALDPALRERITAWDPEENGNGNDPAPARPRIRHAGLRMLQRDRPPHDRLLALTPAQHDKPHLPYLLAISESGGQVPGCAWCAYVCEGPEDCFGTFVHGCRGDVDQFVAEGLVADAPGRGGLAEAEVADEEDLGLVDAVAGDSLEFVEQQRAGLAADVGAWRVRADR